MSNVGAFGRLPTVAGWCGLAGALIMFAGDQLIGHGSRLSDSGLITLGGLAAIPGGAGLLAGVWHIREQLAPAPSIARLPISLLFATLFVLASATHAVWGAYAIVENDLTGVAVDSDLFVHYLGAFGVLGQVLGIPASLALLALVLLGRTSWPRWMALFNPGLLYFGLGAIQIPGQLGAAIAASTFNFAFCLFFLASGLAPWRQVK